MTRPRWKLVTLAALALVTLPGAADAAEGLAVGLYCPSLSFERSSERVAFVERLGRHLGRSLGVEVRGLVFGRRADLDAAVRGGRVDLVLADAIYFAERGARLRVLATTVRGDVTGAPWKLVTLKAGGLAALERKRVAVPRLGRQPARFASGFLLEGELPRGALRWLVVPDAPSAAAAMRVKRAEAALLPQGTKAPGARVILETRVVPFPRFGVVVGSKALSGRGPAALRRALSGFKAPAHGVEGWRAADGTSATTLTRSEPRQPLLSQRQLRPPDVARLLLPESWPLAPLSQQLPPPVRTLR